MGWILFLWPKRHLSNNNLHTYLMCRLVHFWCTVLFSSYLLEHSQIVLTETFSQNTLVDNKIIIEIFLKHQMRMFSSLCMTRMIFVETWETFLKEKITLIDFYSPNHILNSDGRFLDHHKSFMIESPSIWSWIFFFDISPTNIINEWLNK